MLCNCRGTIEKTQDAESVSLKMNSGVTWTGLSPAIAGQRNTPSEDRCCLETHLRSWKKDALTELSKEAQLILGDEGLFCHLRDLLKAGAEEGRNATGRNQCIHPTKCKTDS